MTPEIPEDRVAGRAVPLPEEKVGESAEVDHSDAAEMILRESEERVSEATESRAPGDVADQRRRSEETAGP